MKHFTLPKCPYCGRSVSYADAWLMKNEGEYTCPKCRKKADVVQGPPLKRLTAAAGVLCFLLFLPIVFFVRGESAWGALVLTLPYLAFLIIAPYYLQLRRTGARRAAKYPQKVRVVRRASGFSSPSQSASHDTLVMPAVKPAPRTERRVTYEDERRRANKGTAYAQRPRPAAVQRAPAPSQKPAGDGEKRKPPKKQEDIQSILEDFIGRYGE